MFFNNHGSTIFEFVLYPVVCVLMITWMYMCVNLHFTVEVAYYVALLSMSVYYTNRCLDSCFNAQLMREDAKIGNFSPTCTFCEKQLCENLFFLQYVHGSCTPFNCPTSCTPFNCPTHDVDAPEVSTLQRKKKTTPKKDNFVVEFRAKHRYCDDCLPRFLKFQSGNRQAVCRDCNAALDPSSIPPRNRFWLQKTLVIALQFVSLVVLYLDKVCEKGYLTNV